MMRGWWLSLLLLLCFSAGIDSRRVPRRAFRRDDVERVSGYPFHRDLGTARRQEPVSHLMEYLWGGFGTKMLPLREAVESLPAPLRTSEERSLGGAGRVPLRDAVEMRPPVSFEATQQPFLMPQLWRPDPMSPIDDDTVEILPSRWEYGRSLVSKKKGKKNKRPMKDMGRNEMRDPTETKIVCYLEGWANYRQEPMKFNNAQLDPFACTHIIYAFAAIDPHRFFIYPQDEEHDLIQGGYRSVVGLRRKNPDLKVLISIGGWSDDDPKFSVMTSTANRRQKFIRSVAKFLDKYGFDGVDLDWQYPGAEDGGGNRADKENLAHLLEELSEVFRIRGWLLSLAVPASRFRVDDGYDVVKIAPFVDLINVLAFGFHTERDLVADHHAPLFRRDSDRGLDVFFNADYAVQYWIKRGAPRSKIILGIPFFGRSFTLQDAERQEMGAEVVAMGQEGRFTQESGFMAYFEVCDNLMTKQWTKKMDSIGSPYMVRGNQWVGYDDVYSVKNKGEYIKQQRLGGAGVFAIDLDDFNGICGEKWPLLKALKRGLNQKNPMPITAITTPAPTMVPDNVHVPTVGTPVIRPGDANCTGQGYAADPNDCRIYHRCQWGSKTSYVCPGGLHFDPSLELCNYPDMARCQSKGETEVVTKAAVRDEYKVVCYYTNWSGHRKGDGKFVPENMNPSLCTHVVYAYATLDPNDLIIKPFDPMSDLDNDYYGRLTRLASSNNAKALLGLGGWTDSTGNKYSRLVRDSSSRTKFARETVGFLKQNGFDGLHIDWNYPKCWQSNCNSGPDSDKANYAALIRELRSEFNAQNPKLILAAGISGYREVIDVAYDVPSLSRDLDFMSIMTYDYHGAWEKRTAHISPLYYRNGDSFPRFNTNYTLEYLATLGADRKKLIMGIPFYGQSFTLSDERDNGYGARADGPGNPGEITQQPGMLAYYEICNNVRKKNWIVSRDAQGATGPYAFKKDQWVSYDDIESVIAKAKHVRNLGFGGAVAFTTDLDDFRNLCCRGAFPLLKAIGRIFGHSNDVESDREDCTPPPPPVTPPPPATTTGVDSGDYTTPEHVHPTTPAPSSTTWPSWTWTTSTEYDFTTSTTRRPTWTERPTTLPTRPPTTTSTTTERTTTTSKPWWETTSTTSSVAPPTSTDSDAENVIPSQPCEPGRYYPDPTNCNAYYRCLLGEYQKNYCVGGLHWNPQLNSCDWPESAKCDKEGVQGPEISFPTSTTPVYTTTTETQWSTRPSSTQTQWTRPTTTETQWTRPTTTETQWTRPSTTQTQPSPTTPPSGPCSNGEYYADPGSCEAFAVCVNGRLVYQRCASGLHWNQQQKICDWSKNAMCSLTTERLADGFTTVRSVKENLQNRPCESGTYASYPGDCNKYLSCLWGLYQVYNCAPGLHWNNEEKTCDWPNPGRCKDLGGDTGGSSDQLPPGVPSTSTTTWRPTTAVTTTQATTTTEPPLLPDLTDNFKVVCYFTNWAWYRQGHGKYLPEDIDANLCTHVVYGFAVLDYENLIVKAHDSWADFDNRFYERVVAFKKKGIKVSLAIGGWNDSQGDKYSRLVNNPAYRARFNTHVVEFLLKHNFDGLDLDWEYPKCWQVDCKKGPDSDKQAFADWVRELHNDFAPHGLLLSSAVSPSKTVIDAGYDVPALGRYLDWIAVMTYDFHGQWDKKTGHVAPMYYHEEDDYVFFNANYSINYWIAQGAPRRKIVMGMPLYGQSFQLSNADQHGLNANAPGPGEAGEFTRAAGFLAYYEICDRVLNRGWTVVKDPKKRMGPYAYRGNQWVSFDDVETITQKAQYIRDMNLGGGMIWDLSLGDFRNRCNCETYPALKAINRILRNYPGRLRKCDLQGGKDEFLPDVPPTATPTKRPTTAVTTTTATPTKTPGETVTQEPTTLVSTSDATMTTPSTDPSSDFKIVCYFTNWAWYRQGHGKYLPEDIDANLCTHVIYGFAVLDYENLIVKAHDSWADYDNKFYDRVVAYKKKGVKVSLAIGGWNDSQGDKYSRLVNNPAARARFIKHVVEFLRKYDFDGLDLDWEYPKCWQVDCKKGPDSDKEAFVAWVRELHEAFAPHGLLLSSAVSPSKTVIDAGYDVQALGRYLDWIAVMTYDFHGQWDKKTGHVAPMYFHEDDDYAFFNANYSINYWISQGAPRRKIVMGMPFYGQSFQLSNAEQHGLNANAPGPGEAGEFTRAAGFLAYYEICDRIQNRGWTVVRDPKKRMGPYAYRGNQWVSFDDVETIIMKAQYVKNMNLGGGMLWDLSLDDFRNRCHCETYPQLKAMNRVLRNYPGPQPKCELQGRPEEDNEILRKPTKSTPIEGTMDCRGKIFSDHPNDCNKYYQCEHGQLQVHACPDGLHWNRDHCDWPANANCNAVGGNEIPEQTTTTTTAVITTVTTPRPGTTTKYPPSTGSGSDYKVVCYFTNWAWYRQGPGKYTPENIDFELCTHIAYGFAVLDGTTLTIKPHDSWADLDNNFYTKVTELRLKGVKVLIAIGGWNDSLGDKYSRLVADANSRRRFIENVAQFIEKYGFDGLDLDWEYPKCWQVNCNQGPDEDKANFATFVRELSEAFKPRGWLLSSAVSPSKIVIDLGYDVPELSKYFDYISVMTYDFHGHWDKATGHVAPLYYVPGDTYDYFNANFSLNYWIEQGAEPKKLIMGMPFYGQSFTLSDPSKRGLNAPASGPGEAGDFTRAAGFLAFYEICDKVKRQGWTVVRDDEGRIGPYAYRGNQWVSYDDVSEIRRKTRLIKKLGLGGSMIWALDLDDFRNRCGCGTHPLLKTLNQELRGVGGQFNDCT